MRLLILGLIGLTGVCAQTNDIPVLTVCEVLREPSRYNNRNVIIVGRVVSSMEGSYMLEERNLRIRSGNRIFDPMIDLSFHTERGWEPAPDPPAPSVWNSDQISKKLREIRQTTKLVRPRAKTYPDGYAAVFGRIETELPRFLRAEGESKWFLTAYGEAAAQLVWSAGSYRRLR